jgi:taurine dioxygenase
MTYSTHCIEHGVDVTPLTGGIGAAVRGVDLATLSPKQFDVVRSAFLDRCMLTFPNQNLDDDGLTAFARQWGEIMETPMLNYMEGYPGILEVRNRGKALTPTEYWHYDSAYLEQPPALSILAAHQLPETGGDTMWCNQYLAYETLSDGMKTMLAGKRAKFTAAIMAKRTGHVGEIPFAYHPLIRTHPETGRKALFLSGPDTVPCFENMSDAESRPILDFLYNHSPKPDRSYRHQWRSGDVVMWDNRCTMHYAVHDHGDAPRIMHRVTIAGGQPV